MSLAKVSPLLLAVVLAGCGGGTDLILPGERLDVRTLEPVSEGITDNKSRAISLPPARRNTDWPQRAYAADHAMPNAALGANLQQVWAAEIGNGNDRRHRITADPVVADGRIFTLDAFAGLRATDLSGNTLWSRDLTPAADRPGEASGGGLAVVGGQVFAATGYGDLFALNATDGVILWKQDTDAIVTGAPTVSGGLVYAATRDSRALVIDASNGRLRWQLDGAPSVTSVTGGAAPAVGADLAIFPFSSGQLRAAYRKEGFGAWQASVAGARLGRAYADIGDVTGDPVIAGGRVYAGSPSGRFVALDLATGERIWTADVGATGPAIVVGGSVFTISDNARLVRMDAASGAIIWQAALPDIVPVERAVRQRDVYAHFGPLLAAGRLWVASGDGMLRTFSPVDGSALGAIALGAGAASRPVVAGGTLYVVTSDGMLRAFR